ncbi:MAG: single-stranded DNA-binding protein [Bacteroidales bacterium]|nr:single-stranded DNA-binding protein [Bacteroidales bacterium]
MSVNKAILIGFVGNDPEVRYLDSGTPVANFRLATSESYTNKGGEKITQTEWHNIVVWRGLAEVVEKYVKKGTQLYIEGRIRTRAWDDRDGNKRYTTEIVVDTLQMMGRKGDNAGDNISSPQDTSEEKPPASPSSDDMDNGADDLPF